MKAYFLGYQEDLAGNWIALYNIIGGEKSGSSVTERTLIKDGIEVPPRPTVQEWLQEKKLKQVRGRAL